MGRGKGVGGREEIGEEGEEGKGGKKPPNKKTGYGAGWRERRRREGMEERRDFVGQSPSFPPSPPFPMFVPVVKIH